MVEFHSHWISIVIFHMVDILNIRIYGYDIWIWWNCYGDMMRPFVFFDGTCGILCKVKQHSLKFMGGTQPPPHFWGMLWGYHGSYNAI